MQKKILLPLAVATALLAGFLIGYTVLETVPSDGFVIIGEREAGLPSPDYEDENRGKIDINTASAVELADLPGIGPALAERIIEYREEQGRFASVDDLQNVKGIGEKTLERLRPYAYASVP